MPETGKTAAITRRAAIGGLAASGLAFAALGPRGKKQDTGGRLVLDYWEKWTRHEGDAMVRVVDAFNASQNRIFVRYLVTSDIGQKSLVAIAGGGPPDVIGLYAFNVPPYAESNAIIPLDELAPRAGLSMDIYAPGVKRVMTYKDRWWATVNTAGSVALYYNRTLFKEAGLNPDRPPATIAELDECHTALVRRSSAGALTRAGFLHREPGWWSWIWGYHFGGPIYDEKTSRSLADSPETLAAMRWMQTYGRSLGADDIKRFAEGFGNYFTPENPFLTGKLGMIVQGPWIANLMQAFKPDLDYGVAPFPMAGKPASPDAPVGLIDTDVLVIPRGARNPEASMEFIAFTQRQDMTELLATAHCKPSPLREVSRSFMENHPNRGIGVHYAILNSAKAFVPPRTPVWQNFKDEFDTGVQQIWRLEVEAEAKLADLQRRTQALLDRDAAQRRRRYSGDRA